MATYTELRALFGNDDLRNKVEVAVIIAAEAIRGESVETDNHANRLVWAKAAFSKPQSVSDRVLMSLLAAYSGETVGVITGASDAAIQTAVNNAVNIFADGS
jgi:hypothetical protein